MRWALEYKRAHKGKGKLLEILRSSKARGITWNTLAVKTTFHSSLKKKNRKQNKPSHRFSKSHLIYSSALFSTFAKESCLLNSDPIPQTLSRSFSKVLANVSQIPVHRIMSGCLPQSLLRNSGKMEIPGSCPRNLHSVGLTWGPGVCNLKQICPSDYNTQANRRITAPDYLMDSIDN